MENEYEERHADQNLFTSKLESRRVERKVVKMEK